MPKLTKIANFYGVWKRKKQRERERDIMIIKVKERLDYRDALLIMNYLVVIGINIPKTDE